MLFLLQEGPAQTANYLIAGYIVIFGVMALYLVSLIVRRRNLNQDLEALQEMQEGKV
jgi:CcmD family protein